MKVWKLYRQGHISLIPRSDLEESHWVDIDAATFTPLWQAEADNALLDKLGLGETVKLFVSKIVSAAMAGKVVPINAARGLNLKRSRVNGEQRLADSEVMPATIPI